MSKKAFNSDLDSVFSPEAQYEPNIDSSPWLLRTGALETATVPAGGGRVPTARKSTRKSFASDLDSLFVASVAERPREQKPAEELAVRQRERPRRSLSVLAGLDALIRDTTDGRAIAKQEAREAEDRKVSVPKRVTFTYDRDQFARLKRIAREEGSYLKDIISGLLNDFVEKHPR